VTEPYACGLKRISYSHFVLAVSTDPHAGNLGVELLNLNSTTPAERVRLVYYDFGQVAELQQNQANGILAMIESIVDMDVDRSVESFREMGVLKEGANLTIVRAKVADNYRTGKVKANRKRLKQRGYQFQDKVDSFGASSVGSGENATKVNDAEVMQYFTLPAEYAFVGRALTQMHGVGQTLDPDFDFVSASAPWIYEIKGAGRYLQDEAVKWITNFYNQLRDGLVPKVDVYELRNGVPVQSTRPSNATKLATGAT
jgi:predicted unusual protein kinase regulating ubiquinone biosynthesis (AarF/ABC1/UbiB family)